jgi:hypothetical protein
MFFSFLSAPPRIPAVVALLAGTEAARASTVDGDHRFNAAVILGLLGVWAVLMGLKNLRELRYRPLQPEPVKRADRSAHNNGSHGNDAA